jgi:hypothetical protein
MLLLFVYEHSVFRQCIVVCRPVFSRKHSVIKNIELCMIISRERSQNYLRG